MSSSTASNSSSGSSSAKKLKLNSGKPAASAEHKSGKTKVIECVQKAEPARTTIKRRATQEGARMYPIDSLAFDAKRIDTDGDLDHSVDEQDGRRGLIVLFVHVPHLHCGGLMVLWLRIGKPINAITLGPRSSDAHSIAQRVGDMQFSACRAPKRRGFPFVQKAGCGSQRLACVL